ncbi:MAG: dihydroneopterin aldolase [Flavobacteriales bacterium]
MYDSIKINSMRFHAFHGHLPVERKTGNTFVVDLILNVDLQKSGLSDKLEDTVNYVDVMDIITQEMNIPSDLIEHVAERIATRLKKELPLIKSLEITVKKEKPPLHFDLQGVEVSLKR